MAVITTVAYRDKIRSSFTISGGSDMMSMTKRSAAWLEETDDEKPRTKHRTGNRTEIKQATFQKLNAAKIPLEPVDRALKVGNKVGIVVVTAASFGLVFLVTH